MVPQRPQAVADQQLLKLFLSTYYYVHVATKARNGKLNSYSIYKLTHARSHIYTRVPPGAHAAPPVDHVLTSRIL